VAVRHGAADAAGDDGLEGHALGPGEAGGVFQLCGDGHLGHAGLHEGQHAVEERAAHGGGGAHPLNLFGVLDLAQAGDEGTDRDELRFGGL